MSRQASNDQDSTNHLCVLWIEEWKCPVRVLYPAVIPRTPIGNAPDMEKAAGERSGEEAVGTVGGHESVDWTTRRGD